MEGADHLADHRRVWERKAVLRPGDDLLIHVNGLARLREGKPESNPAGTGLRPAGLPTGH